MRFGVLSVLHKSCLTGLLLFILLIGANLPSESGEVLDFLPEVQFLEAWQLMISIYNELFGFDSRENAYADTCLRGEHDLQSIPKNLHIDDLGAIRSKSDKKAILIYATCAFTKQLIIPAIEQNPGLVSGYIGYWAPGPSNLEVQMARDLFSIVSGETVDFMGVGVADATYEPLRMVALPFLLRRLPYNEIEIFQRHILQELEEHIALCESIGNTPEGLSCIEDVRRRAEDLAKDLGGLKLCETIAGNVFEAATYEQRYVAYVGYISSSCDSKTFEGNEVISIEDLDQVVIRSIKFRSDTSGYGIDEGEIVSISNLSQQEVDLTGWKLDSAVGAGDLETVRQTYFFPDGCILPPKATLSIHSVQQGTEERYRGKSTPCNQSQISLYPPWNNPSGAIDGWWEGEADSQNAIWHDDGDAAWLYRPAKENNGAIYTLVDSCHYTGAEADRTKRCHEYTEIVFRELYHQIPNETLFTRASQGHFAESFVLSRRLYSEFLASLAHELNPIYPDWIDPIFGVLTYRLEEELRNDQEMLDFLENWNAAYGRVEAEVKQLLLAYAGVPLATLSIVIAFSNFAQIDTLVSTTLAPVLEATRIIGFRGEVPGKKPESISMKLANSGKLSLDWKASVDVDWISLQISKGLLKGGESFELVVSADPSGFSPGTYNAEILLESDAVGEEIIVDVILQLECESHDIGRYERPVAILGGMAVDEVEEVLYWASADTIQRCNVSSGANCQQETVASALNKQQRVVLDQSSGLLYWTAKSAEDEWVIQRCAVRGDSLCTPELVAELSEYSEIMDVAVDSKSEMLFWLGREHHGDRRAIIGRCSYQGDLSCVPEVLTIVDTIPTALDIDEEGSAVYWAEWKDTSSGKIMRCSVDNLQGCSHELVATVVGDRPYDISIDHVDGSVYWGRLLGGVFRCSVRGALPCQAELIKETAGIPIALHQASDTLFWVFHDVDEKIQMCSTTIAFP